eukprot:15447279-Alexandrium_andersonii.AAC.1
MPRLPAASSAFSMHAGACVIDFIDSSRYSVRSILGGRAIADLPADSALRLRDMRGSRLSRNNSVKI